MNAIIITVHIRSPKHWVRSIFFIALRTVFVLVISLLFVVIGANSLIIRNDNPEVWKEKISSIAWVSYSPTAANPDEGIEAEPSSIRKDLALLHEAGFTGLVTYSSFGLLGSKLPSLAKDEGFEGLIMGVWDPSSQEEIAAAKAAARNPIIIGFCVGNEGLMEQRYEFSILSQAINELRNATGKPVTTTEIVERYTDQDFLQIGDWIFPNAHPYFHDYLKPDSAIRWTQREYEKLTMQSNNFVIFKEVGLPTAGDPWGELSESSQETYYLGLAKTDVKFVYFEAYDQPWKDSLPIEPHWGIFYADRAPKSLGQRLIEKYNS